MDAERARYATAVFFGGAATILGIVAAVFLVSLCADRLSCINVATLTAEELEARRLATSVTRKSGLAGLLVSERVRVYRAFFEKRAFPYFKAPEENENENDDDVEAQKKPKETDSEIPKGETDVQSLDDDDKSEEEAGENQEGGNENEKNDDEGKENDAPACSICLNEYGTYLEDVIVAGFHRRLSHFVSFTENGEKVIIGTACSHMFHYNCFMQWVDKENEECPYCREHMISPQDFYETAKKELGVERVEKLKKVNDGAEARMRELQAMGATGIPSPAPVVASHPSYQAAAAAGERATSEPSVVTTQPVETNTTTQAEVDEEPPKVEELEIDDAEVRPTIQSVRPTIQSES